MGDTNKSDKEADFAWMRLSQKVTVQDITWQNTDPELDELFEIVLEDTVANIDKRANDFSFLAAQLPLKRTRLSALYDEYDGVDKNDTKLAFVLGSNYCHMVQRALIRTDGRKELLVEDQEYTKSVIANLSKMKEDAEKVAPKLPDYEGLVHATNEILTRVLFGENTPSLQDIRQINNQSKLDMREKYQKREDELKS